MNNNAAILIWAGLYLVTRTRKSLSKMQAMKIRRVALIAICLQSFLLTPATVTAKEDAILSDTRKSEERYMELGTETGGLGGAEQKTFERAQIKSQILTFIPPLFRPAFTQHAYIFPPNAFSISVAQGFTQIDGRDFFLDGDSNKAVFKDFDVERHFTDVDLFYGFDLNRKYLHGFTLRINIPYLDSNTDGFIHPNGQPFISIENAGSTSDIGDVGLFVKKKLIDQGTFPIGIAAVGAVFFPTGSNDETFGSNGRVTTGRPQPPAGAPAAVRNALFQGFDAFQALNVAQGNWGDGRCFFRNFNLGNRALCDGPAAGPGGSFGAPAGFVQSFDPASPTFGANGLPFVGDFPFNDGVFGRFSDDGRLPAGLQPGTGDFSFLIGSFFTRQFSPGSTVGRSAAHIGATHRFVFEEDGIDRGDTTTVFASFVKPVYKDFLAADLTFVGFEQEDDEYAGKIAEPEIHTCDAADVAAGVGGCAAVGAQAFVFEVADRPSFSGGFTGFIAPSLIFSPDPQIRGTLSGLFRVVEPDLGPAPDWVVRGSLEVIF